MAMRTEQEVRDAMGIMGLTVKGLIKSEADPSATVNAESVRRCLAWVLGHPDGDIYAAQMFDASGVDQYRRETAHERN